MRSTLSSLGEFGFIKRVRQILGDAGGGRAFQGIGDDTSVHRLNSRHYQLLTHDLLLEDVHFLIDAGASFKDLGWKALAVNLSDIAAMGGRPSQAVVGLGIPKGTRLALLEDFYLGLKSCSKKFHCPIVGGDTNFSSSKWVIAVTVLGSCSARPLLRSGARAGDSLWVSGTLGDSALGFKAIQKKDRSSLLAPFVMRHVKPMPRLDLGEKLRQGGMVGAMMDISDGLGGDLQHLASASGVALNVDLNLLPRKRDFEKARRRLSLDARHVLLEGGEDYELVFTVRKRERERFIRWVRRGKIPVTEIGQVVQGEGIQYFENGKRVDKKFGGFRHF